MDQILEKLTSLFGFSANQPPHEDKMNKALQAELEKLRNVDPQTQRQWMRLQKAIVENAAEAPSKSRSMPRFAFATSVVAFAIVGVYLYFTSLQPAPERFSTVRGQQKEVVLNDGSQVTLNYATELVVQKLRPGDPRRLSLSGEAFFRVEKNNAPFIVSTSFAEVHVVGTEFNVRAREDALEVAVIRGVVNIRVVKDGKDSTLVLSQHQMALSPQKGFPRRIGNIPSQDYPGWIHGKLFFDKTSFLSACREIEMRFDVIVNIQDSTFGEEKITGVLDAKSPTSALTALCDLTGKRFKHEGDAYTIY